MTTPDIVPQQNASSHNTDQNRDRTRDRSRDREVINNIFSQSAMSLDELSNSHSMGAPSRTNSLGRDSRLARSTDTLNLDGSLRIHEIDLDSQEILDKIKSLTKRVKKLERNKHSGTFGKFYYIRNHMFFNVALVTKCGDNKASSRQHFCIF